MIIDCDSHYLPLDVYKYVSERYKKYLPTYTYVDGVPKITGSDPIKQHDNPYEFNRHCDLPGVTDIPSRLEDMEKMQVNMQVLAPQDLALRFNYSVDPDLAAEMCHSYNLSLLNLDRNKFILVGYAPLQSIESSIKEVEWLHSVGINQIYVDFAIPNSETKLCGLWRTVKDIDKFLKVVEANGMILYAHHFMHSLKLNPEQFIDKRLPVDFINGFISDFTLGGLLHKFPDLKIVLAESPKLGAELVKTLGLCIQLYEEGNFEGAHPNVYYKKNFYATIDIEAEEVVENFIKYFGEDKVLFSTDYPHIDPSGMNKWNDTEDLKKSKLNSITKEKIAYKNAVELFNLNFGQTQI